jgi:hypothetical protein
MQYAAMMPADLTPADLACKLEMRWSSLEDHLQRLYDKIEALEQVVAASAPAPVHYHPRPKRQCVR